MNLNPQQQEAVDAIEGAVLISAAPGSGKTRVVTERIKNILMQGYSPHDILAVTFTNSAAHEMEDRLRNDLPDEVVRDITICTFHRLAMSIIRQYGFLIGRRPDFSIYDAADQLDIIKSIMKDLGIKKPSAETILKKKGDPKYKVLFTEYRDRLVAVNAFDFDMLIDSAMFILENYDKAREELQYKFRFISIDEFQDVNIDQYRMAKILSGKWKNICVVGDTDQNIFAFNGSDVKFMLRFAQDFNNVKSVTIDTTYRCPSNILSAATSLVRCNINRIDTTPKSIHPDGVMKRLVFESCFEEAAWIADRCQRLLVREYVPDKDIAILCRTHRIAGVISKVLANNGLQVNMCGSTRELMSQTAAQDFNAYVRLIANPYDRFSFRRAVKTPKKDIEWRMVAAIESLSRSAEMNILDAAQDSLSKRGKDFSWVSTIKSLKSLTFIDAASIIKDTLCNFYDSQSLLTRSRDLALIFEVVNDMIRRNNNLTAEEYLEDISELSAQHDATEKENSGINIMTAHTAKGLEWPFVFVPALEMGTFPIGSNPSQNDIEDERRLFYVALTRAQKGVFVTGCRVREVWGKERETEESLFIREAGLEKA